MSKYAHFMTFLHPFSALEVAQSYLDNVFKLHGLPNSIVSDSDRDSVFLSNFWQALVLIQQSWHKDPHLQHILHQIQQGFPIPNYEWINQQLRQKGKLLVGLNSELRQKLFS